MLTEIFFSLIEVSITVSIVIFALILLSPLLNRIYAIKWKYWLWLILAVRLILPVNLAFPQTPVYLRAPEVQISVPQNLRTVNSDSIQALPGQQTALATEPDGHTISLIQMAMMIWLAGFLLILLFHLIGYHLFKKQTLRWCQPIRNKRIICQLNRLYSEMEITKQIVPLTSEKVSGPMMIGFIKPMLIIPYKDYRDTDLQFILKHELVHFKRHDIWYKLLLLFANAVHWFNPLVYLMLRDANKDLELSCDDEVTKDISFDARKQYSETILAAIHHQHSRQTVLSSYFYGGAKVMKERFINIMDMKKRHSGKIAFLTVLVTLILVGGLVACSTQNTENDNVKPEMTPVQTGKEEPDTTPVASDNEVPDKKPVDTDNTDASKGYQSPGDFLNSPEGVEFQIATQKFAKAFFSADEESMKKYLIYSSGVKSYGKDIFDNLDYLILKWGLSDIKSDNKITASYQYKLKGEDSDSYLSLEMKKIKGVWKVAFFALEK